MLTDLHPYSYVVFILNEEKFFPESLHRGNTVWEYVAFLVTTVVLNNKSRFSVEALKGAFSHCDFFFF